MFKEADNCQQDAQSDTTQKDYCIHLSTTQLPLIAYGLVNSAIAKILNDISLRFFELAFHSIHYRTDAKNPSENGNPVSDSTDTSVEFFKHQFTYDTLPLINIKQEQIETSCEQATNNDVSASTTQPDHSVSSGLEIHADLAILRDQVAKLDEGSSSLPHAYSDNDDDDGDDEYRSEKSNGTSSTDYSTDFHETTRVSSTTIVIRKANGVKRKCQRSGRHRSPELTTKRPHTSQNFRYQCPYPGCELTLTNKANWLRHIRKMHSNSGPYACTYPNCERRFDSTEKLENHIHVHFVERTYPCDFPNCGKRFPRKSNLKSHQLTHINQPKSKQPKGYIHVNMQNDVEFPYTCFDPGCGARFRLRSEAEDHAHEHPHWPKRPIYRCPVKGCHHILSCRASLRKHLHSVHEERRPHVCTHGNCGRSFHEASGLAVHMRIHTGEKPYVCSYPGCEQRFRQKCNWKQHERRHQVDDDANSDSSRVSSPKS